MDALLTIPTLVSPSVEPKLLPAVCKLVERNIAVTYKSLFIEAMKMAYLGPGRGLSDSYDPVLHLRRLTNLLEATGGGGKGGSKGGTNIFNIQLPAPKKTAEEEEREEQRLIAKEQREEERRQKLRKEAKEDKKDERKNKKEGSDEDKKDVLLKKTEFARKSGTGFSIDREAPVQRETDIEVATGVSFYRTINLEPTYLQFQIKGRSKAYSDPSDDPITRDFTIGIKCVPFHLDGVTDLKKALSVARNRSVARTWYSKMAYRTFGQWIKRYRAKTGRKMSKVADIFSTSPTALELTNKKILAQMFYSGKNSSEWSPLVIFSKADFDDREYAENIWQYKQLVKGGWGDMIVMDNDKETINFCFQKDKACYQLGYIYLRQLLNIDDVIDAGIYAATSSGFGNVGAARTPVVPSVKDRGTRINAGDLLGGKF